MIPDAVEIQPKWRTGDFDPIPGRADPYPETFFLVARPAVATTPGFDGRLFVSERNEEDNLRLLNGVLRVRDHLSHFLNHFEKKAMPRSIRPDDKSNHNWSRIR